MENIINDYETVIEFINGEWHLRKHRLVEPMKIKLETVMFILENEKQVALLKG